MLPANHHIHSVQVLIVEVGYVSDTEYEEKLKDNIVQHGKLIHALGNALFETSILLVTMSVTALPVLDYRSDE